MNSLILLLLTSPFPYDPCAGLETAEWRQCQPRMVVIGTWNPIPYDYSPDTTVYPEPPKAGYYKTEQGHNTCKAYETE